MTYMQQPPFSQQPPLAGGPESGKNSKRSKKSRPRRGRSRTPMLAAVLAIMVTLGVALNFVTSRQPADTPDVNSVLVYQASRNIAVGTILSADDFTIQTIPADLAATIPGLIMESTEEGLRGAIDFGTGLAAARRPLATGTMLTTGDLTTPHDLYAFLAEEYELEPGHRFVSIEATPAAAIAGRVRPGDRVDIYAYSDRYELATALLSDILVVAVELPESGLSMVPSMQINEPQRSPSDILPPDPLPGIYILAVPSVDALNLITASQAADLVLTMRHPAADETSPNVQSVLEVFCPGVYDELVPAPLPAGDADSEVAVTVELPQKCREAAFPNAGVGGGFPPPVFDSDPAPAE